MMDASTATARSDPIRNPLFRRRWQEADARPVQRPPTLDQPGELDGVALLAEWRRFRAQQTQGGAALPEHRLSGAEHFIPGRPV